MVDSTGIRFVSVISSILLLQAVKIISFGFKKQDSFLKKGNKHWTSVSLVLCQVFMIVTAIIETLKFNADITIFNVVGIFLIILILLITNLAYTTLGENYSPFIKIKKRQVLVDYGIYKYVRHPMDLASLILMIALPLVGSATIALFWLIPFIPILTLNILYEESVLKKGLKGYTKYMKRTKVLIPFIW